MESRLETATGNFNLRVDLTHQLGLGKPTVHSIRGATDDTLFMLWMVCCPFISYSVLFHFTFVLFICFLLVCFLLFCYTSFLFISSINSTPILFVRTEVRFECDIQKFRGQQSIFRTDIGLFFNLIRREYFPVAYNICSESASGYCSC